MMEQLILHLIGDYVTQSHWMAENKTKSTWAACCHATVYSLPFLLLTRSPIALLVIWLSHLLIDRFRVARFVVYAKNRLLAPSFPTWAECNGTGYHKDTPAWLAVWLMIAADNTIHLIFNYCSIRWL